MLVFAVDAGPTKSGCVSMRYAAGRFYLVEGAHHGLNPDSDADLAWMRSRIQEAHASGGFVAGEMIVGFAYEASRVAHLVETSRTEGVLWCATRMLGARMVFCSASEARTLLVLDKSASDARVAIVVEWILGKAVRERFPETIRAHVYDAALLAVAAVAKVLGLKVRLPAHIVAELLRLKAEEGVRHALRKAEKASAKPLRAFLEKLGKQCVVPPIDTIGTTLHISRDAVVTALRIVSRSRADVGKVARTLLQVNGIPSTDPAKKRHPTKAQSARRSAAQRARRRAA